MVSFSLHFMIILRSIFGYLKCCTTSGVSQNPLNAQLFPVKDIVTSRMALSGNLTHIIIHFSNTFIIFHCQSCAGSVFWHSSSVGDSERYFLMESMSGQVRPAVPSKLNRHDQRWLIKCIFLHWIYKPPIYSKAFGYYNLSHWECNCIIASAISWLIKINPLF